jgi:hypothetical protein
MSSLPPVRRPAQCQKHYADYEKIRWFQCGNPGEVVSLFGSDYRPCIRRNRGQQNPCR